MSNFRFSGHETFHCRHFWLKKGIDFLEQKCDFKDENAVVELGVGKNMVSAINFWLNAFGLIENSELSELGKTIFHSKGFDPYLEDIGSLWVLHYKLMSNNYSSINRLVFEDFRKNRISSEFTISQIFDFIERLLKKNNQVVSANTLETDIKVFLRNYVVNNVNNNKNIEDDFSSIFLNLKLISNLTEISENSGSVYRLEYDSKDDLNPLILLFAIKDTFENEVSVSVNDIQIQVSDLFLCNREGTEEKLIVLQDLGYLVYKEDAGRKEIQFKFEKSKWDILKEYYEANV